MACGEFTELMGRYVSGYIRKKCVWDLGAGDLTYAKKLQKIGAVIHAVDKEPMPEVPGIKTFQRTFEELSRQLEKFSVAFVSWPVTWDAGLGKLVSRASTIIYLGQNDLERGTACGGPDFWSEVITRKVNTHLIHPKNTLIIYGRNKKKRKLLKEEQEAYDQWSDIIKIDSIDI